uniref:dUTP diphosphatase n=1 Tax=Triticum urartu TaxID=4572 RepID=A0A8R7UUB1_TRIUA
SLILSSPFCRYGDQAGEITQDYLHATGNVLQAGEISHDYHSLVGVVLFNPSEADFAVKPGECIAQMIVQVIATPEVAEVEDLDANATVRGEGGFGSTGV